MQVKKLRLLRQKHGISMPELARLCGISAQRISEIELTTQNVEPHTVKRLQIGLELLIAQRGGDLQQLCHDYRNNKDQLTDFVEVCNEL